MNNWNSESDTINLANITLIDNFALYIPQVRLYSPDLSQFGLTGIKELQQIYVQ